MRHNTSRAIPVGKNASEESIYPAISNWLTSFGSLNGPQAVLGYEGTIPEGLSLGRVYAMGDYNVSPSNAGDADVPVTDGINAELILPLPSAITTFGSLCSALKTQYPDLMEGDIVTVTLIHQILQGIGEPAALLPGTAMEGAATAPAWRFAQFRIDTTSTKPIAQAYGSEIYLSEGLTARVVGEQNNYLSMELSQTWQQVYDEIIGGEFDPEIFANMSSCVAGVVTFSRETPNGLRVSTEELSTSQVSSR